MNTLNYLIRYLLRMLLTLSLSLMRQWQKTIKICSLQNSINTWKNSFLSLRSGFLLLGKKENTPTYQMKDNTEVSILRSTDNSLSSVFDKIEGSQFCPNFFVTGDSCSAREKTGFEIVGRICERGVREFKGVEKYFTVRMPFCNGAKEINNFLSHLQNSVSIARDCYDVFKGIVIVELDSDWANNDCEKNMQLFFDYIKTNESICFILLFPGTIKQNQCRNFYNSVCDFGYWVSIEAASPTVEYCINLFVTVEIWFIYTVVSCPFLNISVPCLVQMNTEGLFYLLPDFNG